MHTQVLQVGLRNEAAQGVGHTADAYLECDAVVEVGEDVGGDLLVDLAGAAAGGQADVLVALHHIVHLRDVDVIPLGAVDHWHMLVDLQDDVVRGVQHLLHAAVGQAVAEIAVLVHGGHGDHGNVHRSISPAVIGTAVTEQHGRVIGPAFVHVFPVQPGAMPGIIGEGLMLRVLLHHLNGLHGNGVANLDILQFPFPGRQGGVQCFRKGAGLAVIHPVAVLHQLDSFFRGYQLFLIFFINVHGSVSPFSSYTPEGFRTSRVRTAPTMAKARMAIKIPI